MDFRPSEPEIRVQDGHKALDSPSIVIYYVPVRGPPGLRGEKGDLGPVSETLPAVISYPHEPSTPQIIYLSGQKGDPGADGVGVKGDPGDPGDKGDPGIVSHDFSVLKFRYGDVSKITSEPTAIITRGLPQGSWGIKYETNPSKSVSAFLAYQNYGVHRLQIVSTWGVEGIYLCYEGEEIISQKNNTPYIDLDGSIPIISGTLVELTIKWK